MGASRLTGVVFARGLFAVLGLAIIAAPGSSAAEQGSSPTDTSEAGEFASWLSPYEPMYFLAGWRGGANAKFQISFRVRITHGFCFSYTQTSLWDLDEASRPFRDTSYKPRLFWSSDRLPHGRSLSKLGLEAGFGHESNGKDGSESRSIDVAYVRPMLWFGPLDGYRFVLAPRAFVYLYKSENPDIPDYRGYLDLDLSYGRENGLMALARLRKGTKGGYGSIEAAVTYPLSRVARDGTGLFATLEYFNGWGEDILNYDERLPWQVRIGLSVVR